MSTRSNVRFVYLAEPIDQAGEFGMTAKHRAEAADALNLRGVGVYRPSGAFRVGGVPVGPEVTRINTAALSHCDAMLAFLPAGVASVGVPIEIEQAVVSGKAVAVVTDHIGWALHRPEVNLTVWTEWEDAVDWLTHWVNPNCPDGDTAVQRALPFVQIAKTRMIETTGIDAAEPSFLETTGEPAELPRRGYADDAGLDLSVSRETMIEPKTRADLPTNVAAGFPPGLFGMIVGRSSALRRRGVQVTTAIIDPGFRGELYVEAYNPTDEPIEIKQGERIGQIILLPSQSHYQPVWVDELPPSHDGRGVAGFGSTGS